MPISSACFRYFKSPVAGGFFNLPKDGKLVGPIASSRSVE